MYHLKKGTVVVKGREAEEEQEKLLELIHQKPKNLNNIKKFKI
ncbi:MAG: hypothetical protein ACFE8V_10610 [Promethearchaeota archaeon]